MNKALVLSIASAAFPGVAHASSGLGTIDSWEKVIALMITLGGAGYCVVKVVVTFSSNYTDFKGSIRSIGDKMESIERQMNTGLDRLGKQIQKLGYKVDGLNDRVVKVETSIDLQNNNSQHVPIRSQ